MKSTPLPFEGQLELVRPPAPGRLEMVRTFLNTVSLEEHTDVLESRESYGAWLADQGLVPRRPRVLPTEADLAEARAMRSALRDMTARNNSVPSTSPDSGLLAGISERAKLALVFDPEVNRSVLTPTAGGIAGALGAVLAAVHVAMLDRSWERLKQCADPSCAWSYYDHSKNGCSRWCSPDTCGNRNKVKAYRERKAQPAAPAPAK